jgi:hypothetical protein
LAAVEKGVGGGAGAAAGADGLGVSGIRTDATFAHTAPPLPQVAAVGSGVLTEVSGIAASAPPITADAAAPTTAILMTDPSSRRPTTGAGDG